METFWLCFLPLFIAVDPIGLLPIYLNLTEGLPAPDQRRILRQSILTAMLVAVAFLFLGRWVFDVLGITQADFLIAGGILLFIVAMSDLLAVGKQQRRVDPQTVGAVPIGVPLTVGPASLTAMILLANQYGTLPTVLAMLANLVIAGAVFWFSHYLLNLLGRSGVRIISKVVSVILAAFAVMMIRKGILDAFRQFRDSVV
ncbi:MAG: MarC family protein [Rhodopirellula sp.]|nr:MarC family protein [Rhodopirellula sp.]